MKEYRPPQTEWSTIQPAPFICESPNGETEPYGYENFEW